MKKLWKRFRKELRKHNWHLSRRDTIMVGLGLLVCLASFRLVSFLEHEAVTPLAPQSVAITIPWIPNTIKQYESQIDASAKKYDIDPNLVAIIMTMESGGYAGADSGQALGLMQITPTTAPDIAKKYLKDPVRLYDLKNPDTSIEFGTAYLSKLRDIYGEASQSPTWDSTVEQVAAAYNGGFGAANALIKGEGLHDEQTVVYSRDAFNMWRERHSQSSPTFDRWKERGGNLLIQKAQDAINIKKS